MAFRNRSADVKRFSMVPRADIPRSVFVAEQTHKTTFDAGYLIPIYIDEVLPADQMKVSMTAFTRLSTPIVPVMDNLYLDTFFFFVPTRLVWNNWVKMMGEQSTLGESILYNCPTITSPGGGWPINSVYDYFGLPTVGQVQGGLSVTVNSLALRCYNLIYNTWFRDENLGTSVAAPTGDGPDGSIYTLLRRGKRHDYFTSCLPWPEKPNQLTTAQGYAYQGGAPVTGLGTVNKNSMFPNLAVYETGQFSQGVTYPLSKKADPGSPDGGIYMRLDASGSPDVRVTIANMRQAFQVQKLMERDARGGTRYTELIRSHFGVISPDARAQRPEYIGGGTTPITVSPIAQTSSTGITGGSTPLGALGGIGTGIAQNHRFGGSFTEHGFIIGLANVRADLTYQQGLHKMWKRSVKYDYYWPAFAHLGEQPVYRYEIFADGSANDLSVFGYQERWAEYKHKQNRITGLFRSTATGTIDVWHLAQRFAAASPPALNNAFIEENPPVERITAVGAAAAGKQFLFDALFSCRMVRAMPAFSVPGLTDHF